MESNPSTDARQQDPAPSAGADRPIDRLAPTDTRSRHASTGVRTRAAGIRAFNAPVELLEVEVPEPQAGQLLVRLAGAGAGLWDVEEARGIVDLPLPKALGWQGSGVVEQVGPGVTGFGVGDPVLAYAPMAGFYAERVTVPAAAAVHAPKSVPLADAATLLIGASTAYQALVDVGRLQRGRWVLITAGAGGTGSFAVELAKHLGAHVVATAGPDNLEFLAELGADEVFDYHDDDVVARIRQGHPGGVDLLVDNVSSENFSSYAPLVRRGGIAVGTHEPQPEAPNGVEGHLVASWERPASFAEVVRLLDEGVLRLRVGRRFALEEAERAHDHLRSRHGRGTVLLVP